MVKIKNNLTAFRFGKLISINSINRCTILEYFNVTGNKKMLHIAKIIGDLVSQIHYQKEKKNLVSQINFRHYSLIPYMMENSRYD